VSSSTGAIPESIGDVAWLVDPFDADALVCNMLEILSSPDLAERMRNDGLRRSRDYSWVKAALEAIENFENVAR
jgi:glycosyltransferase involved in cell wall biosynthesis